MRLFGGMEMYLRKLADQKEKRLAQLLGKSTNRLTKKEKEEIIQWINQWKGKVKSQ